MATENEGASRATVEGRRMARRVFAARGDHSEAHLSEYELACLLELAYERGAAMGRNSARFR